MCKQYNIDFIYYLVLKYFLYDVENIYIVDGSLFVTSASVNPTPTIQALALYVAENLIRGQS